MGIAEQIYEIVKTMPEQQAQQVLDFVEFLKARLAKRQLEELKGTVIHTIELDEQAEQRLNRLAELTKIEARELIRTAIGDFIEMQKVIENPDELCHNNNYTLKRWRPESLEVG